MSVGTARLLNGPTWGTEDSHVRPCLSSVYPRWDGAHTMDSGTRGPLRSRGQRSPRGPASIAIRCNWPEANPYTRERGRSLPQAGERWSAERGALQFTDILQGGSPTRRM